MATLSDRYSRLLDAMEEHGVDFIAPRLASGEIPLRFIRTDGRIVGTVRKARLFYTAEGEEILRTGMLKGGEPVVLERAHITAALHKAENVSRPKPALVVDNIKPMRSGGRPSVHDWAGAAAAAAEFIVENDYPEIKANLVNHLKQWFGDKRPDERDIERFVDTIYKQRGK